MLDEIAGRKIIMTYHVRVRVRIKEGPNPSNADTTKPHWKANSSFREQVYASFTLPGFGKTPGVPRPVE